ncbi:MAG: hypothetical protein U0401_15245 [Anaerolineae bacterium]
MANKTNHKNVFNNIADVTDKITDDTKTVVDSMLNATTKAAEDSQAFLAYTQGMFKENLDTWKDLSEGYANLVIEVSQWWFGQSVTFRQSRNQIMADNLQKVKELSLEERQLALTTAEFFQSQIQTSSEYAAKIFTTTSKVMTTTALFSDWAAERAAKMFTTISAN